MKNTEDFIWDRITESAISKFDFEEFGNEFNETINDIDIFENIVFITIIGFASKKEKSTISLEIFNQVIITGFEWELEKIKEFLKDKEEIFQTEIYCASLAMSMLENGNNCESVLNSINSFL